MKEKYRLKILLSLFFIFSCVACKPKNIEAKIEVSDMKNIAELSTMECYYHTVAKYDKKIDNPWFKPWAKDMKRFWIEYSGVVTMGVDVSQVKIEIKGDNIEITIPEAEVLDVKIDADSLDKKLFYKDKESAEVTAEDERNAFATAQEYMKQEASHDKSLLSNAKQRAKDLLEGYVNGMGNITGKKYNVEWIEVSKEKK